MRHKVVCSYNSTHPAAYIVNVLLKFNLRLPCNLTITFIIEPSSQMSFHGSDMKACDHLIRRERSYPSPAQRTRCSRRLEMSLILGTHTSSYPKASRATVATFYWLPEDIWLSNVMHQFFGCCRQQYITLTTNQALALTLSVRVILISDLANSVVY